MQQGFATFTASRFDSAHPLVNLLGFKLVWWMTAFWHDEAAFWVLAILIAHVACHPHRLREVSVIASCAFVGISVDAALFYFNFFSVSSSYTFLPLWLILLWFAFAATLANSLSVFYDKYLLAAISGAVLGPFSYLSAAAIGVMEVGANFYVSVLVLAVVWTSLFPGCVWLAQALAARFDLPTSDRSNEERSE